MKLKTNPLRQFLCDHSFEIRISPIFALIRNLTTIRLLAQHMKRSSEQEIHNIYCVSVYIKLPRICKHVCKCVYCRLGDMYESLKIPHRMSSPQVPVLDRGQIRSPKGRRISRIVGIRTKPVSIIPPRISCDGWHWQIRRWINKVTVRSISIPPSVSIERDVRRVRITRSWGRSRSSPRRRSVIRWWVAHWRWFPNESILRWNRSLLSPKYIIF